MLLVVSSSVTVTVLCKLKTNHCKPSHKYLSHNHSAYCLKMNSSAAIYKERATTLLITL